MPLFLADHSWKKEKQEDIVKGTEVILKEAQKAKNMNLLFSYMLPSERIICIWEADKAETLEKWFKAMMKVWPAVTKVTPIWQTYPPPK